MKIRRDFYIVIFSQILFFLSGCATTSQAAKTSEQVKVVEIDENEKTVALPVKENETKPTVTNEVKNPVKESSGQKDSTTKATVTEQKQNKQETKKTETTTTTKTITTDSDYDDLDALMAWLLGGDGDMDGFYSAVFGQLGPAVDINPKGMTVETRIGLPEGYERVPVKAGSYEDFYRKLPLKPDGTAVYYYNGQKKEWSCHVAVYDFPQLKDDLLQCADACMKMRAEYYYSKGEYNKIGFNAESGVYMPFSKYVDGYRLTGSGWKGGYAKGASREIFDEYLRVVYSYASTRSLAKELLPVKIEDLKIGDVFVKSGSPGHSVFVTDMAVNKKTGQKIMLLGQGYMPAQDLHIVESMDDVSPWFYVKDASFGCEEFSFPKGSQGRWPER